MPDIKIPLYEGALPYLYVCFSPEDEDLVLPVLARMYNEGFRLWSASAAQSTTDFSSVRHVNAAAGVVMFMSHNLVERLNSGVPEVLASARSALLRTVVLLDDASPDNRAFALASPERVEYRPGNDAAFWLYVGGADYLERCRGPWPTQKVLTRQPVFEDVREEAIEAEYVALEQLIEGASSEPTEKPAENVPQNNEGYIPPRPDGLVYIPLDKVEAARTEHDRDYDEVLGLLTQCADKQTEIIINHPRPAEGEAMLPHLTKLKPLEDRGAELANIKRELMSSSEAVERPERVFEPVVLTKADMVVEPPAEVDPLSAQAISERIDELSAAQPVSDEAEPTQAQSEEADALPTTAEAAEPERVEVEPEPSPEPAQAEPVEAFIPLPEAVDVGVKTVQVLVRKQQHLRVPVTKKRVIVPTVSVSAPAQSSPVERRGYMRLGRASFGAQRLPAELRDKLTFEQYVRDIALSAVAANTTEADGAEQPRSARRYAGRPSRQQPEEPCASVVPEVFAAAPAPRTAPADAPADDAAVLAGAVPEKSAARKSRFPHNSALLTGLMSALRRERAGQVEEPAAMRQDVTDDAAEPQGEEPEPPTFPTETDAAEGSHIKVIRLSDAISERRVSDLQAAVNKFMNIESSSEAVAVVPRMLGIRR